jgi:Na+-transporting methylmalonyl-CoA/oxaloacetate decarboxylase gamma subunit
MGIDWSYAALVGLVGFGMVVVILIILIFFIWITGKILAKKVEKPVTANQKV